MTNNMQTVENYGWTTVQPPSHDYLMPAIVRIAKNLGARKVLDLGCGNGTLAATLAREGFDVTGCDADANGIEIARRSHPGIAFRNVGIYDKPAALEDSDFDLVVSTEVVEHLFTPRMLPRFARAVLRPNGHLVLTTPYHGYLKNLTLSLLNKWDRHLDPLWDGGHIKFWSPRTLSALLQEESFGVTEFTGVGRIPFLWKSMILSAHKVG